MPDERPPEVDEEDWNRYSKNIASHSQIRELIEDPQRVFFIGGYFEACLGNFMVYHKDHYSKPDQELFYVSELCISDDENASSKMTMGLAKIKINPISYEETMRLLRESAEVA